MSDAEQFYTGAIILIFAGLMLIAFGAVAMRILDTRAKQADLARDRQARDDKAVRTIGRDAA